MYEQRIGVCWEPEKEDVEYNAVFNFDPINGGILDLIHGEIKNKKIFKQFLERRNLIFHGLFQNQYYTFFVSNVNTERFPGIHTTYDLSLIIEGDLITSLEKLPYKEFRLGIPYLEDWMNLINCNIIDKYDNDFSKMKLKLPSREKFGIEINNEITVEIHSFPTLNVSIFETKINRSAFFKIIFNTNISLRKLQEVMYHIIDLITLACNKPMFVNFLKVRKDGHDIKFLFRRRFGLNNVDDSIKLGNVLFSFSDIMNEESLNLVFRRWFDGYKELKSVYRLFFLTYYSNDIIDSKFLQLAQALDYYSDWYINENENFKYNHLPFKKRIEIILSKYNKLSNVINSLDCLIKAIVETRNDLSHGYVVESNSQNYYLKSYDDFIRLYYGLKLIITIILLDKLSFSEEAILSFIDNFCLYKTFTKKKYIFK